MKNKFKGSKTMEFLTLFLMVVGTTVGAGIYMKNNEVLGQTQNPIIGIILWTIVGIVCVMSLIVFIEISSSTKNEGNGTIGNWTKLFINRKLASFFSVLYIVAYIPTMYAWFAGSFLYFMLLAIGVEVSASAQLAIYLVCGLVLVIGFGIVNGAKPEWSKSIQVFGTVFKFIPLLIAFVAGFCLIKTSGNDATAMWNTGDGNYSWSKANWKATGFIRGFGGILLAFDGYVYLANAQKDAVHKDVVPKALLAGLITVSVFYVLMAVSLFVGSKDGTILNLFQVLFKSPQAGRIFGAIVLMLICVINMNIISMVGTVQIESDSVAKLLYTGAERHQVSKFKSAMISTGVTAIVYVVFILLGFFIPTGVLTDGGNSSATVDGWNTANAYGQVTNYAMTYINIMSSVSAIISFTMVTTLIFAMIANRFTNKVKVDKKKGALTLAFISGILFFLFIVFGIYTFIDPMNGKYGVIKWVDTSALPFIIILVALLAITTILWLVQEKLFKIYPFENGFEGYIKDEDPRPFIFKFNPIINYYTKKGTEAVQEYQKRLANDQKQKRH